MTRLVVAIAVSMLAAPSAERVQRDNGPVTALELVRRYNERPLGSPGWRTVTLELMNGPTVARTFSVLHLWRRATDRAESLVLLDAPAGLRGTSYLLAEDEAVENGMHVSLHLPAGRRRVLTVKPGDFDKGLLGSDFGYEDLRWTISTRGRRMALLGETVMLGRQVRIIEAAPQGDGDTCTHYYLTAPPALVLLGVDYGRHLAPRGSLQVRKSLRVERLEERERLWTPTRIVMSVGNGQSSVLTLTGADFWRARFPPSWWFPSALPGLSEQLRSDGIQGFLGNAH